LTADNDSLMSGGSESSIDVGHLSMLLSNMSHPSTMFNAARVRPRGRGHRHRISQARMSRSSVYETIEEEQSDYSSPLTRPDTIPASPRSPMSPPNVLNINNYVWIVDSDSLCSSGEWDPNLGISMRKYFALKDEACETVEESQRMWQDTPFSVFAVQCELP
jgi:serine/arginine repetitive matrix protein 2